MDTWQIRQVEYLSLLACFRHFSFLPFIFSNTFDPFPQTRFSVLNLYNIFYNICFQIKREINYLNV